MKTRQIDEKKMDPRLTDQQRSLLVQLLQRPLFTKPQIAQQVECSVETVYRYGRNLKITGRAAQPRTGRAKGAGNFKIRGDHAEALFDLLAQKSDLYLDEMQEFLYIEFALWVSISAISAFLKRHNWTKKRLSYIPKKQDAYKRAQYLATATQYDADMFVFVDESGIDRRTGSRRIGWNLKGKKALRVSADTRGNKRFTLLPTLSSDGLLEYIIYEGHTDAYGFLRWVVEHVLPKMQPFPNRNSILVMDNASWHYHDELEGFCQQAGVKLMYLPAYSPDYNPIESFFGDLKKLFRRRYRAYEASGMQEGPFLQLLRECADEISARTGNIRNHFRHCGYNFRDDDSSSGSSSDGESDSGDDVLD